MPASENLREWIIEHDHKWLFVVSYVALAVVLSIAISLFWLVVVVAVHLTLELLRQYYLHHSGRLVLLQALWEVKLDIALVIFALALTLYMDAVLGILGIRSAAQLGGGMAGGAVRGGARFVAWQRALRGFLLSVDDLIQVFRAFSRSAAKRRRGGGSPAAGNTGEAVEGRDAQGAKPEKERVEVHSPRWGDWTGKWGVGDWLSVGLGIACVALMILAPLTTTTFHGAIDTLLAELHPYPFGRSAD